MPELAITGVKENIARFENVIMKQSYSEAGEQSFTTAQVIDEETGSVICECEAGGGGGGESDFSTAEVTITNDTNVEYQTVYLPFSQEAAGDVAPATSFPMIIVTNDASQDIKAVLYKGACMGFPESESVTVEVTGDITVENGTFIITGDGTITLTNTQA